MTKEMQLKCDNLILAPVMMLALACFHGLLGALICTHNNLHHVQILTIIDQCRKLKKTIKRQHGRKSRSDQDKKCD